MRDGPLDMRMGQDPAVPTAAEWLRTVRPQELERVLREYGEERFAGRIARTIVVARRRHRIERTAQLADLVVGAGPRVARHGRIHAATRAFREAGLPAERVFAFRHTRAASDRLGAILAPGDVALLRGRGHVDHLTRIVYGQYGDVACWKDVCLLKGDCDWCPQLGARDDDGRPLTLPRR